MTSNDDQSTPNCQDPSAGVRDTKRLSPSDDDGFNGQIDDDDATPPSEASLIDELLAPGHAVMERHAILAALTASGYNGTGYDQLSSGEEQRVRTLKQYLALGLFRPHVIGSPAMLAALAALDATAPNFAAVTRLVRRAALVSQLAGTPIRIQPLCLIGSPGIGKSRYVRLLAQALGTSCDIVNGSTLPDVGSLTGYPPVWRSAGPGRLAKFLLAAKTSGPVVLVDEAEKIHDYEVRANPLDKLLPILEHDTARIYQDEYLLVPMAAQHATILFAVNSLDALSAPFRDRVAILLIADLDAAQREGVLDTLLTEVAAHLGLSLSFASHQAKAPLRDLSPRRCRLALEIAIGIAVDCQRRFITVADCSEAVAMLSGSDQRTRFGFFPEKGAVLG